MKKTGYVTFYVTFLLSILLIISGGLMAAPARVAAAGNSLDAADGDPVSAVYVDDEGKVGIGTTGPDRPLLVTGEVADTYTAAFINKADGLGVAVGGLPGDGSGNIQAFDYDEPSADVRYKNLVINKYGGNVVIGSEEHSSSLGVFGVVVASGFYSSSDERLKENVTTIEGALDKVSALRGVEFEWNGDEVPGLGGCEQGRKIGLIAQEVEQVLPGVVLSDDKGYKAVEYDRIVAVLIEAVKELKEQNGELKDAVKGLEAGIESLEKKYDCAAH